MEAATLFARRAARRGVAAACLAASSATSSPTRERDRRRRAHAAEAALGRVGAGALEPDARRLLRARGFFGAASPSACGAVVDRRGAPARAAPAPARRRARRQRAPTLGGELGELALDRRRGARRCAARVPSRPRARGAGRRRSTPSSMPSSRCETERSRRVSRSMSAADGMLSAPIAASCAWTARSRASNARVIAPLTSGFSSRSWASLPSASSLWRARACPRSAVASCRAPLSSDC